jgi:hypothetical protein
MRVQQLRLESRDLAVLQWSGDRLRKSASGAPRCHLGREFDGEFVERGAERVA